ncbi:phosphotyrosine protein phosphatase [Aliidiomarina iranensis]|uniref:protein-tyrosine-phosphatase n=1 Tax=Aliidiomarina iranensis TaxID=1434071 RepID=A0A432VT98_9GAMM|nr:low molecular weight protein-tyrosine-phosphatase [Aliidiomarina iranensis]RUO19634.1 phosphotyrosine protein phosphatase [Aliidiomarina iranensis]
MFEKILIVCVGNICRSPTAEFLLKRELPHKQIASAGLHAMVKDIDGKPVGDEMNAQARETAEKHGLVCGTHEAQQLTSELARKYDLILVMEKRHRDEIAKRFPEALAKTMLFGQWDNARDIPDPYKKSDEVFAQIYKLIEHNTMLWANKLKR